VVKLKSSLSKVYSRHHDLINPYVMYVSQMTTFMFRVSCSQSRSALVHELSPGL